MGLLNVIFGVLLFLALLISVFAVIVLWSLAREIKFQSSANTPELLALLKEMQKKTGTDNEPIEFGMETYVKGFCQVRLLEFSDGPRFYQIQFDARFLDLNQTQQGAILAHELGHIKLGHFALGLSEEEPERELLEADADIFAEEHAGIDIYWTAYEEVTDPSNFIIRRANAYHIRRQLYDWLRDIHGEV